MKFIYGRESEETAFPFLISEQKEVKKMIAINKNIKEIIAEKFPDAHFVRTMKKKSKRHHYYVEETPRVLSYLKELRGF